MKIKNMMMMIVMLSCIHVFIFCSIKKQDDSDFLTRNNFVLSPEQKVVYDLFVATWKILIQQHLKDTLYEKFSEEHKEQLAYCILDQCNYKIQIKEYDKDVQVCKEWYEKREKEMKEEFKVDAEIKDDWCYKFNKECEGCLLQNIQLLQEKIDESENEVKIIVHLERKKIK